eukprot:scaffold311792_cov39-Tisochrysis_lutea.AAC.2
MQGSREALHARITQGDTWSVKGAEGPLGRTRTKESLGCSEFIGHVDGRTAFIPVRVAERAGRGPAGVHVVVHVLAVDRRGKAPRTISPHVLGGDAGNEWCRRRANNAADSSAMQIPIVVGSGTRPRPLPSVVARLLRRGLQPLPPVLEPDLH